MNNLKKNKQLLVALAFVAVIMIVVTIYMGTIYFSTSGTPPTQPVIQTKVKATDENLEKVLVLNNPSPTIPVIPTDIVVAPTSMVLASTDNSATPTPTEIILAFNTPMVSSYLSPTSSTYISTTSATITRMQTLPKTGFFSNSLILFAVASTLIFVAFLF